MYWTEIFFILFILFYKGIYWFYELGQENSLLSIFVSPDYLARPQQQQCSAVAETGRQERNLHLVKRTESWGSTGAPTCQLEGGEGGGGRQVVGTAVGSRCLSSNSHTYNNHDDKHISHRWMCWLPFAAHWFVHLINVTNCENKQRNKINPLPFSLCSFRLLLPLFHSPGSPDRVSLLLQSLFLRLISLSVFLLPA